MINSALYRSPELLDPASHRRLRIGTLTDFSVAKGMHGAFVTAAEIPQAALEYAVVFVRSGELDAAGQATISPIVLLGMAQGENLYVDGTRWDARHVPAFIRRYPFLAAALPQGGEASVMIDTGWSGLSESAGEPLFEADGKPAAALTRAIDFLKAFETEAHRTRLFCARLLELDVLKEMKADATLPDGGGLSVGGFLVVEEEKLQQLPDATVLEMHRNGMLMLLHLHLGSLVNVRTLLERKARRAAAGAST